MLFILISLLFHLDPRERSFEDCEYRYVDFSLPRNEKGAHYLRRTDYINFLLFNRINIPREYAFYVYILTNPDKTTLYIGFTNNLTQRLFQHYENRGNPKTFAGRYYCYNLIYYEVYQYVNEAIAREKELKKWSRKKKVALINPSNPNWNSLNQNFIFNE